ncbi:hypothetical protein AAFF_G00150850 [Aldrovandia affinis]|uniref:Uncharacterized protein n=1 Tax=Aldrovandia affinis TaxID=143900 RepID=A0AAD7RP43_9TELE|nr:hypothetical protein AAFF_G00150850 [Aldrovandia affinis]
MRTRPASKSSLSIFQVTAVWRLRHAHFTATAVTLSEPSVCPLPQTALTSLSASPSSGLPGDALNSVVDSSFIQTPPAPGPEGPRSSSIEVMAPGSRNGSSAGSGSEGAVATGGPSPGPAQGTVLQFFTKLRRHASLEGASPYFNIKKWKFDSSQRASSLDTRVGLDAHGGPMSPWLPLNVSGSDGLPACTCRTGQGSYTVEDRLNVEENGRRCSPTGCQWSPKRRQFQRQRAASESMDREDHDAHHIDIIQYIARTHDMAFCPGRAPPATCPPPPSAGIFNSLAIHPPLRRRRMATDIAQCCCSLQPIPSTARRAGGAVTTLLRQRGNPSAS